MTQTHKPLGLPPDLAERQSRERAALAKLVAAGAIRHTTAGPCDIRALGNEVELFGVDEAGRPAWDFYRVIRGMKARDKRVGHECLRAAGELSTAAYPFGPTAIADVNQEARALLVDCNRVAKDEGMSPLEVGLLPSFTEDDLQRGAWTITPCAPRYQEIHTNLGSRHGNCETRIPGMEQDLALVHESPVLASLTSSFGPNLEIFHERVGLHANFLHVLAPLFNFLASTSPIALGKVAAWMNRAQAWSQGMGPGDVSPFGIGRYFSHDVTALLEWVDFVRKGEAIIPYCESDYCGDDDDGFTGLHHQCKTRWVAVVRVRFAVEGNSIVPRLEVRFLDKALTGADDEINSGLLCAAMLGLADRYDSAQAVMSYEEAERAFWEVARKGPSAKILWEGAERSVEDLASSVLPELCEAGFAQMQTPWDKRRLYLDSAANRISRKRTGAHWCIRAYNRALERQADGNAAAAEVSRRLAERQAHQDELGPVSEWDDE